MKNIVYSLAVLVGTLITVGCTQNQPPKTQPPEGSSTQDADYYTWACDPGIGYKLPIPADHDNADYKASRARLELLAKHNRKSLTELREADGHTEIKWVIPGIDFEVMDSKIKLNGKGYGSVNRGDQVRVTHDGKVLLNDQGRQGE